MAIKKVPADDLGDLRSSLLLNAFARVLVGRFKEKPGSFLARNSLRLIEQAVREYQAAIVELRRFKGARAVDAFVLAQGHLETCLVSMHRALNFLTRLRRSRFSLADGSQLIPKAKQVEVLTEQVRDRVRDMRNAIAHFDEELASGCISTGQPIALDPRDSGIALGDVEISWDELARWLRQLHAVGARFSA